MELLTFEAGQATTTPLTPNSDAKCSASGDRNNTTQLAFQYNGNVAYWSPSVSADNTSMTLDNDVGNDVVTFKKGLEVKFLGQSLSYTITVTGKIVDSGNTYTLNGKSLGTFPTRQ